MTAVEKILIITWIVLLVATIIWVIWSNVTIGVSTYIVQHHHLPSAFDGFKIMQVSDLHNAEYGKGNTILIKKIKEAKPDIIVFTGDIIDEDVTDLEPLKVFFREVVTIAPCYFVTGNHEAHAKMYPEFKQFLIENTVNVLEDETIKLEHNGETINLAGIKDLSFREKEDKTPGKQRMEEKLRLIVQPDMFNILLSHRPEYIQEYAAAGAQLVLSGHAHGGQFILPFIGSIYAPGQGLFPQYTRGVYQQDETQLVVSRGAGPSSFPIRLNNRPELVLIILETT